MEMASNFRPEQFNKMLHTARSLLAGEEKKKKKTRLLISVMMKISVLIQTTAATYYDLVYLKSEHRGEREKKKY